MTMDRRYIENNQVIERYAAGRLTPDETERFEEYYLEHPELLEEIEAAERIRAGIRGLAALELNRAGLLRAFIRGFQKRAMVLLLVLLAAPLIWVSYQNGVLRTRLDRQTTTPSINTPVFTLNPVRSGSPVTTDRLRFGEESEQVMVILDLVLPEKDSFVASLSHEDEEVWESGGLTPDYSGSLRIVFPASFLTAGSYALSIVKTGEATTTARFQFEVMAPSQSP